METAGAVSLEAVERILESYPRQRASLIAILQDIQSECYYLPREALEQVARALDLPLSRVYDVATFYRAFSLKPRGRHTIRVCMGTACHLKGSPALAATIERELGIGHGETTPDMRFTLETVNCLGACALAPVAMIDGEYHPKLTSQALLKVLERYD